MKKKILSYIVYAFIALPLGGVGGGIISSCSDSHMESVNTDETKATKANPNSELTTGMLQVYGDFGLMDAVRCYVTGFTQHFAGGWNVSAHAGSNFYDNNQSSSIWNSLYNVGLKIIVDGIYNSENRPNLNAVLRIQRVYMMSILTDIYGDIPYSEAELGYIKGISHPKYDEQKDIYMDFFTELDACIKQLGTGSDAITGDVSAYNGNTTQWKKFANSLRMRFAMRISDVEPEKAKEEFKKAYEAECSFIKTNADNAYIMYMDAPFTLYKGAEALDFRTNAYAEMLYGQDATSPTMLCATFYEKMVKENDPRLTRFARHYNNVLRSADKADEVNNLDYTAEVEAWIADHPLKDGFSYACVPGAAWYSKTVLLDGKTPMYKTDWVQIEDADIEKYIPELWARIQSNPDAGFNKGNFQNRMLRPHFNIKMLKGNTPGIMMTGAETNFLLAEACLKGWISGSASEYYEKGIAESMTLLNTYYDIDAITDAEINDYIAAHKLDSDAEKAKEQINTEAWILHTTNPYEAWANVRRSDYPVLMDRSGYGINEDSNFTYPDPDMTIPVRLMYPNTELETNKASYQDALARMGGKDDWHKRVWWDKNPQNVK